MPMTKCPHAGWTCPHYNKDCSTDDGKDCHYIMSTASSSYSAYSSIQQKLNHKQNVSSLEIEFANRLVDQINESVGIKLPKLNRSLYQ